MKRTLVHHVSGIATAIVALHLSVPAFAQSSGSGEEPATQPAPVQNLRVIRDLKPFIQAEAQVQAQAPATARPDPKELKGKPAPDITLDLLEGGTFKLSDHKDKEVILLDFWATWCGPCRKAMPALKEVSDKYKEKGVLYYAVDLRETPDKIRAYLEKEKLDIKVPLDKDGAVAKQYQVSGIPTMFIIDKKGVIREVHVGFSPTLKESLEKSLDEIL